MEPFPTIVEAHKDISAFPGWSNPEPETGYVWFDAPLEIGGVVEHGVILHGGCLSEYPDCNISFELRVSRVPGRKCIPLMRLDWRSLQGGHLNPRRGNSEWSGRRVSDTHLHAFELNWLPEEGRMRGGKDRLAMDIPEELRTFDDVLHYVGSCFRINNIGVVSVPPWEYDLFAGVLG